MNDELQLRAPTYFAVDINDGGLIIVMKKMIIYLKISALMLMSSVQFQADLQDIDHVNEQDEVDDVKRRFIALENDERLELGSEYSRTKFCDRLGIFPSNLRRWIKAVPKWNVT